MAGEENIISGAGNAIGGINALLGQGLIGAFIAFQLPMTIIFVLTSFILFYMLFWSRLAVIMPWSWSYVITAIRLYADGKIMLFPDRAAIWNDQGLQKFKIEKENVAMQLPSVQDVYGGNEVMLLSFSHNRKLCVHRQPIYEKHLMKYDIESIEVSNRFIVDTVQERDPNIFFKRINSMYLIWIIWFFSGLCMVGSNFLIIYPIYVKFWFMGGG